MNLDNDCVPVVASTTNDALNSGCDRFQETLRKHDAQDKYIAPRLHVEWLEMSTHRKSWMTTRTTQMPRRNPSEDRNNCSLYPLRRLFCRWLV